MVAIDTLAQVLGGGDENGSGMQATLAAATDISSELNCAVVLIHHPGHHGKDPRGHSSAMGNADTLLQFEDDGLLRSKVTVRKQKDEESGKTFCVDLKLQQLGRTKAGLLTTTLVVEKIADAPVKNHAQQKRLTPTQTDLMSAYRLAFSGKRETITLSESTSQVEAVSLKSLRTVFNSRNSHKSRNTRGQAFGRAINELISGGLLCSAEYQAEPYIYSRKEEFSSSSGQDRDIRDTLKGVVTLVPPSPVTDLDNVTQCHSVTPLAEP